MVVAVVVEAAVESGEGQGGTVEEDILVVVVHMGAIDAAMVGNSG